MKSNYFGTLDNAKEAAPKCLNEVTVDAFQKWYCDWQRRRAGNDVSLHKCAIFKKFNNLYFELQYIIFTGFTPLIFEREPVYSIIFAVTKI